MNKICNNRNHNISDTFCILNRDIDKDVCILIKDKDNYVSVLNHVEDISVVVFSVVPKSQEREMTRKQGKPTQIKLKSCGLISRFTMVSISFRAHAFYYLGTIRRFSWNGTEVSH
jgi:hypothetical protein